MHPKQAITGSRLMVNLMRFEGKTEEEMSWYFKSEELAVKLYVYAG